MGVRDAVQKVEQHVAAQPAKPPSLGEIAKQAIDRQTDMLNAILPSHVDRHRFSAMTLQALKDTPKLLDCFTTREGGASFILAVGQAALVGLECNTPLEHAWILPRRFKGGPDGKTWIDGAELSIGYRGLLVLARRTGNVRHVGAQVVYDGDQFDYGHGLDGDYLTHKPAKGNRGELAYAYAIVRFQSGDPIFEVLDRDEVHARRASSPSWQQDQKNASDPNRRGWAPRSPWSQPHRVDKMWRKSAIRSIFPYLDSSIEVQAAVNADEALLRYDPERKAIDVASEPASVVGFDVDLPALESGPAVAVQNVAEAGGSDEAVVATARAATARMLTKLSILLDEKLDLRGDDRLTWLSEHLRPIRSTKDLTFDEVHDLIEKLEAIVVEPSEGRKTT